MPFIIDSNCAVISLEWWKRVSIFYGYFHTPLELSQGMDGEWWSICDDEIILFCFSNELSKNHHLTTPDALDAQRIPSNPQTHDEYPFYSIFTIFHNAKYNHFLTFMFYIWFAKWKWKRIALGHTLGNMHRKLSIFILVLILCWHDINSQVDRNRKMTESLFKLFLATKLKTNIFISFLFFGKRVSDAF